MNISRQPGEFEIDEKRVYLDGCLIGECPSCGISHEHDLSKEYLSHPVINKKFGLDMYCHECGHEWSVPFVINMTISIVV